MKVLFLDFDGVINTQSKDGGDLTLPLLDYEGKYTSVTRWNPKCIKPFLELCKLCADKGYKIVISSSWRLLGGAKEFNEYFRTYFRIPFIHDIKEDLVIGITPRRADGERGLEIKEWLNRYEVEDYIIIDDDVWDIYPYINSSNVLEIMREVGLTMGDVEQIRDYYMK